MWCDLIGVGRLDQQDHIQFTSDCECARHKDACVLYKEALQAMGKIYIENLSYALKK